MKHLKLFEYFGSFPIVLDEAHDYGNITGVIHNDWQYIENWFSKYFDQENQDIIIEDLKDSTSLPIAFLNNINIGDDHRGQGHGNSLYDYYESWATSNGAEHSLLVADVDESQREGFDLNKWYESYGYKKIGQLYDNNVYFKGL